ncbi:potassium voltage-gated channel protein egl-36-like [Tubulanus polymorphus]|uniref:potassium voltage-gated channel protein egl-36-like n=1 Tax=Tubulanus polymorphus TaxID=672921 RepID=UPI003DA29DA0
MASAADQIAKIDAEKKIVVAAAAKFDEDQNEKTTSDEDQIFVINVGGQRFETYASTLKRIPNTRLANLKNGKGKYFHVAKNEFYFDRNPTIFGAILEYYRTGELHSPRSMCGPQVKREFKFWGIDQRDVERCCWENYYGSSDTRDNLLEFEKSLQKFTRDKNKTNCTGCVESVWMFLDNPNSSVGAMIFAIISQLVIILSVLSLILESVHAVQVPISSYSNGTLDLIPGIRQPGDTTVPPIQLLYVDWFCYLFFIVEFIIRFTFCPKKKMFFTNAYFIVDLLAVIWPIIFYIGFLANPAFAKREQFKITLRALESLRVLRLMHIMRFIRSGEVVLYSLRKSLREIGLTILLFIIGITCCGCLMYYAEMDNKLNFLEIPASIWWAMVTMTTVGYGDMYPTSSWGYLVGAITMMVGILLVGLNFSTIINNFMTYFGHAQFPDTHYCTRSYLPPKVPEEIYNYAIYDSSRRKSMIAIQDIHEIEKQSQPGYINNGFIADNDEPDVVNTRL